MYEEEYLQEDKEFEECVTEMSTSFNVEQASFLMTPTEILRNITYEKWRCTARASTAMLLFSYILRKKCGNPIADKIFKEYYVKRKLLASRYTQQGVANLFGYKSRKAINNHFSQLKEEGIFKIEKMPWRNRQINIYIFGSWEKVQIGEKSIYTEHIDMYNTFKQLNAEKNAEKFLA